MSCTCRLYARKAAAQSNVRHSGAVFRYLRTTPNLCPTAPFHRQKRNAELSEEAGSLRNRITALEEANKAFQNEISVLQRALEIRASELSGDGGPEVPSRLLYAVAKGREEGVALAVQLAERTAALRRAEDTAADARDQLAVREEPSRLLLLATCALGGAESASFHTCCSETRGAMSPLTVFQAVRVAEEQASRTVLQLTDALNASRQEAAEARNQAAEAANRAEEAAEAAQRAVQALEACGRDLSQKPLLAWCCAAARVHARVLLNSALLLCSPLRSFRTRGAARRAWRRRCWTASSATTKRCRHCARCMKPR